MTTAQRVAKILLGINAVALSPQKPYRFVSGLLSPIYTDNRLLMAYPLKRKEVVVYFAHLIEDHNLPVEIIAGTVTAGIPPAAWLAELLNLPMIYVRGETKDHGKGNQIEGKLKKGDQILLIEDLISTGGTSLAAVRAIRQVGGKIDACLAFFTYGFAVAKKNYQEEKIRLLTLTDLPTILEMAKNEGKINNQEVKMVFEWQKNPTLWGRKMGFE